MDIVTSIITKCSEEFVIDQKNSSRDDAVNYKKKKKKE